MNANSTAPGSGQSASTQRKPAMAAGGHNLNQRVGEHVKELTAIHAHLDALALAVEGDATFRDDEVRAILFDLEERLMHVRDALADLPTLAVATESASATVAAGEPANDATPAERDERCGIALDASNELAKLVESLAGVAATLRTHEGPEGALLTAMVMRGRQLTTVASTMLGDELETTEGKRNIVRYGTDDPAYLPDDDESGEANRRILDSGSNRSAS